MEESEKWKNQNNGLREETLQEHQQVSLFSPRKYPKMTANCFPRKIEVFDNLEKSECEQVRKQSKGMKDF